MLKKLLGKREFSDWLNPVLIKELKQSVRSRQFVGIFVIVQIVMVLFVIFGLATASGAQGMETMNGWFWAIIGIYLLFLLPLSGLNALGREFDDARLDLLQLSSLNSRGIVIGKWLSLNMQGWLVVLSLLPYIALRYFVGSVNPLQDLVTLGYILYGSLIFSGAAICFSVVRSKVIRVIAILGAVFFMFSLVNSIRFFAMGSFQIVDIFISSDSWIMIPLILLLSVPIGGLFLEFASARISPEAENHETPRRFYLLAILGLWGLAYYTGIEADLFLAAFLVAMIPVTIGCIIKEPIPLPGIYAPFLHFGPLGKGLGRFFLYPGWPAGANFSVAMFAVAGVTLFNINELQHDVDMYLLLSISALGCLLVPRAVAILFKMRDSGMRMFMLIQLMMICVTILTMLIEETRHIPVTNALFFIPQSGILLSLGKLESDSWQYALFLIGNIATTTLSYLVILWGSWRMRQQLKLLEAHAAEVVARQKANKAQKRAAEIQATAEA